MAWAAALEVLWGAAGQAGAEALGPQATANILWAATCLLSHSPLAQQAQQQQAQQQALWPAQPRAPSFPPPALVVAQLLLSQSAPFLHGMTPQQLCNCAWAAATLKIQPSSAWLHALLGSSRATLMLVGGRVQSGWIFT